MSGDVNISLNTDGLDRLASGLQKSGKARVGILGGDNLRADEEGESVSNATLGMIQELGSTSRNIPPRSFLRMPLELKKAELAKVSQTRAFKDAFESGDSHGALSILALAAEGIVLDAFKTSGFGRWAKNKPSTIRSKGSAKPLIDTGELRRAISSEVVDG